jgi:uncharacterized damage-inducible protein DinB
MTESPHPTGTAQAGSGDLKPSTLARIRAARAALEESIARLDEAALTRPGPDGWSLKDHLFHISAWLRKTIAVLHGEPGHEALGVPQSLYDNGDEDGINAHLQRRSQPLPLAEVLADFRASHAAILAYIEAQPEARLTARYNPNDPDDQRRMVDAIAANTYEHDEEHRGWMEGRMKEGDDGRQTTDDGS